MKPILGLFKKSNVLKHVTLDGVRLHLRTDEGKLWINGYYVLYLNKTSNQILESFIDSCYEVEKNKIIKQTIKKLKKKYVFTNKKILEKDLHYIIGIINSFARNEIPKHMIGIKSIKNYEKKAPNRMDISLTYQCNNNCEHCYLPEHKENVKELSTAEWKKIIDKLWGIGIPQIVFSGGECTLRTDLVELVKYSEKFITGIITNGTNLSGIANDLRKAELDWIQITLESTDENVHDEMQGRKGAFTETIKGIKSCVDAGLQVSLNMTLTNKNKNDLINIIDLAKELNVDYVSTNALIRSGKAIGQKEGIGLSETELKEILERGSKYAKEKGIIFNWFLPTCYKNLNPIELGFGQRCCSACSVNMMVEPDSTVIPCQSWTQVKLGNILKDDWQKIWNNPLSEKIRNFGFAPDKCLKCEHLKLCGGSCPLDEINKRRCR